MRGWAFWFLGLLVAGAAAQSTVNLAQELEDTKFSNIQCDPNTNSIVTDIVNGIVSQTDTQFLYSGVCSNQQLLFSPSNVRIAAGLTARVNGTLAPQTGTTNIVGQACSLTLLAVIETIDVPTGTTVTVNQAADTLQFACGNVEVDRDCDWIDLACYWTQGDTVDSSAFWLWVCMFAYLVIIAMYYLAYRLPEAQIGAAKSRKQYAFLEKREAQKNREMDELAEAKAQEVTAGQRDMAELQKDARQLDDELARPEVQRYVDTLQREEWSRSQGVEVEARGTSAGWTLNFSMPSAMSTSFGAPAAGKEAGGGYQHLRKRTGRGDAIEMDDFGPSEAAAPAHVSPYAAGSIMDRFADRFG